MATGKRRGGADARIAWNRRPQSDPETPPVGLFASDHGIALDFDLGIGIGQGRNGDESAAGKIIAEYFPADLREAIAVTNVGDEYGHLHHVAKLAARPLERGVEELEYLPRLPFEVAGQ